MHENDDPVGMLHISRQSGREKFCGIVALEPAGMVAKKRVGGGVRFVESVPCKFFNQVKNVSGNRTLDPSCRCAINEALSLLLHFFGLFFTHCAAQQISGTQAIAGKQLSNLHDLLLIQDYPVGWLQNLLKRLVDVKNRLTAVFSVNEIINHSGLQRSRTKQRHQRDEFFKMIRLEALDQFLHAA